MPFTPFHIGPHGILYLPFRRHLDLITFISSNFIIDIEPLIVMSFDLSYPLHGYCHTFLIGGAIGFISGLAFYRLGNFLDRIYVKCGIGSNLSISKFISSGIFGCWLHILFDSFIYYDIRPLFPFSLNPFLGMISESTIYFVCLVCFVSIFFLIMRSMRKHRN